MQTVNFEEITKMMEKELAKEKEMTEMERVFAEATEPEEENEGEVTGVDIDSAPAKEEGLENGTGIESGDDSIPDNGMVAEKDMEMIECEETKVSIAQQKAEIDIKSEVEALMKEEFPEEETETKNWGLPEIDGSDSSVILTRCAGYQLCMQMIVDSETLQSGGCILYLVNGSGVPLLSGSGEIKLPKEKLLAATDHDVMRVINRFDVNFSEDNRKEAFVRAKEYIEKCKNKADVPSSQKITKAYSMMIDYAVNAAEKEEQNKELAAENKKFKYDKNAKTIAIRDKNMQEVLDEVDGGYSKVIFCKKIRLLERHLNKKILVSNTSGGKGYGFNDTGNVRYYKFNIMEMPGFVNLTKMNKEE